MSNQNAYAGGRPRAPRNLRLHALLAALLTALLTAAGVVVVPAASAAAGDIGSEGPSHSGTGTPTGTKRSTSGLWFHDGTWWGNLWHTGSSDFHIFKFNAATKTWADTGVATDTRANTHHDVLWDGTTLYVASYRFVNDGLPAEPNYPTTMRRYSYDSVTKKYKLLGSSNINNQRVEALTIDKDSTGRVWATWQQGNRIYLNATATDGKTWGTPFAHPASLSNVSVDDTSALIAFDGKMGVMWSRQVGDATDGMYWSYHEDSATSRTAWTDPVAAVSGQRSGDDHMNLKWLDSSGGRVFAAIKTSFTTASQPLIQLLALDTATAKWTPHTIATVAECPNRVIILIDESAQRLRTFATYPKPSGTTNAGVCTTSGGAIYEKSTPLDEISFTTSKTARIVDADQYVHNVTSTKQNLNGAGGTANSGLLLLADVNATSRYWHHYESGPGGGDTTAPTVTTTSPAGGATGVAATTNVTGTFSEAMTASTVSSSTFTLTGPGTTPVSAAVTYAGNVATLDPTGDLAASTLYTATIKGGASGVKDAAGNALAADKTWTFTTAAAAGGGDTAAPTVVATSPADKATAVGVGADVTGTFSEPVDPATVSSSTFMLTGPGTTPVSAAVTPNSTGNVATLNPGADLAADTIYTATIKGGASGVKDAAGNALAADKTWTFTTAAAAGGGGTTETVTLTVAEDSYVSSGAGTTNYGTSTLLSVDASPVDIAYLKFDLGAYAGREITGATLQLRATSSGSSGTQSVKLVSDDSWTETGITYSNKPALGTVVGSKPGPTSSNTDFSVTLTAGSLPTDKFLSLGLDTTSGDGLDLGSGETATPPKLVLTLSGGGSGGGTGPEPTDTAAPTVVATSPADKATAVGVGADVTGTFSEPVDPATVSSSTFMLTGPGTTPVSAAVTPNSTGNVATLNPGADLAADTIYTATIKGGASGVKDAAGNALAADKTWTFTTAAAAGGGGTTETVTLTVAEDSYVSSGAGTTNYGTSTLLSVDASPVDIAYLKFDLGAYAGREITGATLQLRATSSGSSGTQSVKLVSDDSWTETGITYSNKPALGTVVGSKPGPTSSNTDFSVTLTAGSLPTDKFLSLGLDTTSGDGLDLGSGETATPPKLVLTLK